MSSSRSPSALTFIGSPSRPSATTMLNSPSPGSELTLLLNPPTDDVDWGCILCGEATGFGVTNIMWDDGDAVYWDDGDAVLSDD